MQWHILYFHPGKNGAWQATWSVSSATRRCMYIRRKHHAYRFGLLNDYTMRNIDWCCSIPAPNAVGMLDVNELDQSRKQWRFGAYCRSNLRQTLSELGTTYSVGRWLLGMTSWWRHQMETFSALLAICAGNSPVAGEFPTQRPVTWSFDVFFDLRLNKRLSKQWWGWWFETLSHIMTSP